MHCRNAEYSRRSLNHERFFFCFPGKLFEIIVAQISIVNSIPVQAQSWNSLMLLPILGITPAVKDSTVRVVCIKIEVYYALYFVVKAFTWDQYRSKLRA